jgi:hypothetical protein
MGWYITGMAGLPIATPQSSLPLTETEEALAECFAQGMKPPKIARLLAPDDPKKRKALRKRLWKMVRSDPRIHNAIAERAHGEMAIGLGPAAQALARRAAKGRPDAIKLLFEATGFYNPKVSHEHSGDIKVTLDMPRPERVPNEADQEPEVVDAEVVDEA